MFGEFILVFEGSVNEGVHQSTVVNGEQGFGMGEKKKSGRLRRRRRRKKKKKKKLESTQKFVLMELST